MFLGLDFPVYHENFMGLVHKCEADRLSYLFRQSVVMCSDSVKGFCIQICAGLRR